jgi:hypothetical protein
MKVAENQSKNVDKMPCEYSGVVRCDSWDLGG